MIPLSWRVNSNTVPNDDSTALGTYQLSTALKLCFHAPHFSGLCSVLFHVPRGTYNLCSNWSWSNYYYIIIIVIIIYRVTFSVFSPRLVLQLE